MSALMARLEAPRPDERVMPHNVDAEQALIGAALINNEAYRKVSTIVEAEHFYEEAHRRIWEVLAAQIAKGQVATPITLKTYLGDADFGGRPFSAYLANLVGGATTVINAPDYARTVRDTALRRKLIDLGARIADAAYDAPVEATAETLFAEVERGLEALRPALQKGGSGFRPIGRVSSESVYDAYKNQGRLIGMPTGFEGLDEALAGMRGSDLIVIAGRPAMGKTALATDIAVNAAEHVARARAEGVRTGEVAFLSLEMGDEQLKQRIVSGQANVPSWKLRRGLASKEEMGRYMEAERIVDRLPLAIDEEGGLTIAQVKMRARSLAKSRGLSLLVIDYLQLLSGSEQRGRQHNRAQEVGEITTSLKALAKELHVPIIALSQLSRGVEDRDDRRPKLRDLRESGSIEQDADTVIFVYREEYYLHGWKPREGTEAFADKERQMRRWAGVAEIIIEKNRHGPPCTVEMGFEGQYTRFTNSPPPREIEPAEARQRAAKKPSLSAHGTILYGILRSLTLTRGTIVTSDQRAADRKLCKGARLVPLDDARQAFAREVIPEAPENEVKAKFTAAFAGLRKVELAHYQGTPETGFSLWLPEMVD